MGQIVLTISDVKKIISLYKDDDWRAFDIAELYGISQGHVLRLIKNKGWSGKRWTENNHEED